MARVNHLLRGVWKMEMTHEKTREKHSINTYQLTATALMAAVLCALASMSITIGIVPISLATFVIYLDAYILGSRMATVSTFIYLLLGLVGLPVYSGFSSGPAKLFGPTGGYLFGYLFLAFISGWFIERFPKNKILHIVGMVIATAVLYTLGTCWLAFQAHMDARTALMAGVIPFLLGDAIKIVVNVIVGPALRKRINRMEN